MSSLPSPPPEPRVSWRPLQPDDVPSWTRMLERTEAVDAEGEMPDPDELADEFAPPWADAENSTIAAFDDGELVAFGWAQLQGSAEGSRDGAVHLWGGVDPAWRRRGLGSFVLAWQLARAQERTAEFDDGIPVSAVLNVDDRHADRLALADRFGFSPGRNFYEMRRDLSEPIPDLVLPDDIRLLRWSAETDNAVRVAYNESFADHWGSKERGIEEWRAYFTGHRNFRADLSRVAFDRDDIAGFTVSSVYPQDAELKGYTEAWVHLVGVRPAWRGRGLGAALLTEAMRSYAAAGLQFAALDVDTDNTTGALRLYERLGFTVRRRQVRFTRALPR